MCEELEEELERGKSLAEDLVQHMEAMCADQISIPVDRHNERYYVNVIKSI